MRHGIRRAVMRAGVLAAVTLAAVPAMAQAGTAATDATASTVTVQADRTVATIGDGAVGADEPMWNPRLVDPEVPSLIRRAGMHRLEFNGGPIADMYHWRDGSLTADPTLTQYAKLTPQFTFDQFEQVAAQVGADTLVHVNYGTGTPEEAAAWVRYANRVRHYHVREWVIGEEVWGNGGVPPIHFQPDTHADKSPAAYAQNALAFIAAMKAADPTIRVGVELSGLPSGPRTGPLHDWDATVLSIVGGAVDFVDFHQYPFFATDTSDQALLGVPRQIPAKLAALRALVDQYAGAHHHVDLLAGEANSAARQLPQQITAFNALYLADTVLTLLENGTASVAWWALHVGGYGPNRGDLGLLSTGDCNDDGTVCAPPADTPFPPYYGMQLTGGVARAGGHLLSVASTDPLVVAHAVREPDGTLAVLLLNEDPAQPRQVRVQLHGYRAAGDALVRWYAPGTDGLQVTPQAGRDRLLPAYSVTELLFRPAR